MNPIRKYGNWIIIGVAGLTLGGGYTFFGGQLRGAILSSSEKKAASESESEPFKVEGDTIAFPDAAAKTLGLQTEVAVPRRVPITLRLTGRTGLNMERVTHVHAQFPGKIMDLGPALGSIVKGPEAPGGPDTLCVIESTDLAGAKGDYVKARVQLEVDKDTLRRTKELVEQKVLADKFLEDAKSAVKKSQADYDAARQRLLVYGLKDADFSEIEMQEGRQRMVYQITCPRSGIITEKNVTRGELADPTLNLFTIADLSKVWIWGDVYERDSRRLREGQKMKVIVASHPDEPRECTVEWISPVLDSNTRSIRIRGSLDNADGRLLADMYATIVLIVDDKTDSIVVPAEAVVRKRDITYAFVGCKHGDDAQVFERRIVKAEPIGGGIGFGFDPASPGGTTRPAGESVDSQSLESSPSRPEMLRIVEGIHDGDLVVTRGALGLYYEIEQHKAR
ncbi:MAG: efflux RND transporter periplasmic adaptor subunit [Tepidisphaeraceae bacterium]|jgi:cobalt-zinc-cadmium efflux system membrane fusion protein